jgi:hypothetical protein
VLANHTRPTTKIATTRMTEPFSAACMALDWTLRLAIFLAILDSESFVGYMTLLRKGVVVLSTSLLRSRISSDDIVAIPTIFPSAEASQPPQAGAFASARLCSLLVVSRFVQYLGSLILPELCALLPVLLLSPSCITYYHSPYGQIISW